MNDNRETRQIKDIFQQLGNNTLGAALMAARSFTDSHPHLMFYEELENIENDYKLMLDYMRRGFNDAQRGSIYNNLTARLQRFASDLLMTYRIQHYQFFTEASNKASNKTFSNEGIKAELEGFVADTALLELEPDSIRGAKSKELYQKHNDFMQSLFCHIIVSRQWNGHDSEFFKKLLLSPTIDSIDAQLIVSALTLATMNNMDTNKFAVLTYVYSNSTDEKIRQKALVGWVFALSAETPTITSGLKGIVNETLDQQTINELADLQKQIIFCMNAEQDNDMIQRDIIPELMKNNNLNITRFGITEKEDDPTADIFDSGASDRAMEKMEESFQKMMNMQKAGSDIYFGGFSQMKRFSFFYKLANWFYPFYIEHPDINTSSDKLKNTQLLTNILQNGPFCDSDKYSFMLGIASVIMRLPDNVMEMLNSKEAVGAAVSLNEQNNPTYIRRMTLQDMYRFFRLYPQRSQIVNPFDERHFTFVTNSIFDGTGIAKIIPDLCYFAIKHKNKTALKNILAKYNDSSDAKLLLAHGIYELNFTNSPDKAVKSLEQLISIEPDNRRALSLLARAYFETGNYEKSVYHYRTLYSSDNRSKTLAINYCVALSKAKMYGEATNILYKLDIEHPDSAAVKRVLAWTLMGENKYEQAEKEYNRLQNCDDIETGDWLNAGYCQWLKGDITEAVRLFKKFLDSKGPKDRHRDITDEFANDKDFLTEHGISHVDIMLMADMVTYKE